MAQGLQILAISWSPAVFHKMRRTETDKDSDAERSNENLNPETVILTSHYHLYIKDFFKIYLFIYHSVLIGQKC